MKKNSVFHNYILNSSKMVSDLEMVHRIKRETVYYNVDNISRTREYLSFYLLYPEIKWAFLASMVSRNAGWNMCDLKGLSFPYLINEQIRKRLYLTYERANWLIFQDAFPQLLLYHYSTIYQRPLFHLLRKFHVSKFMEHEWVLFYKENDVERLMTALIINEQNTIQRPVIQHPVYKKRIFSSFIFKFQELFHFSCVVFPTLKGELYGSSVKKFRSLTERIQLGKMLASILYSKNQFSSFLEFALETEHTGSRYDYEQYLPFKKAQETPRLHNAFPVINHHIHHYEDWAVTTAVKRKWFKELNVEDPKPFTEWFLSKQNQIKMMATLREQIL